MPSTVRRDPPSGGGGGPTEKKSHIYLIVLVVVVVGTPRRREQQVKSKKVDHVNDKVFSCVCAGRFYPQVLYLVLYYYREKRRSSSGDLAEYPAPVLFLLSGKRDFGRRKNGGGKKRANRSERSPCHNGGREVEE